MKKPHKMKKLLLLGGDIIILYTSLYLTLLLRYWQNPNISDWQSHFWPFTIVFAAWLIVFYIAGLYNLHLAVNNARFLQLTAKSLIINTLLSLAFFYLVPQITIAPKRNLLIYILVFIILFWLWRRFYNWLLKSYLPKNTVAIIGFNEQVRELIQELKQKPHLGYRVAFVLVNDTEAIPDNPEGVMVIKNKEEIKELIVAKKISAVVLAADPNKTPGLRQALFSCLPLKINYVSLSSFYENITGKIPIKAINEMWFLENLSEGGQGWFDVVKRIYDLIFSLIIFFISLPLWPIIGLIIKLESKGPVFFKQRRVGRGNKYFIMVKFRTMKISNDYSPTREKDERITRLGGFLRRSRLDEIPQVLNIILGDMSFVGPRPERPELIAELEKIIPFYRERVLVKPGITGWDQVSGEYHSPSPADTLKKLQYDLFYIKNRSIYLDLSIILKTIATVLSRGGM